MECRFFWKSKMRRENAEEYYIREEITDRIDTALLDISKENPDYEINLVADIEIKDKKDKKKGSKK